MKEMLLPRKINMEPKNHPIEMENHLPNHHSKVQAVNLPGCYAPSLNHASF